MAFQSFDLKLPLFNHLYSFYLNLSNNVKIAFVLDYPNIIIYWKISSRANCET